ncbi:endonuclease/exonuclease/phosphatase domain-containing protein [Tieghemostelium lacteum]|uniref:Endonuclease/exonuclease/phosphatase domain-containing protein n=1 Tax=Tieghemostelium lacteum TaxID=361077 RepID=A0A151ZFA7_TIELA|nr:endonuclease/exonuclease/phosphatase domain-containing protein [Tieghemostelium lacteum]|eukprot:KYQ92662.1 endonuclease/exonuclease/phosphatase domain-containing protein [Tieghemostelium lacteum]
MNVDWKKELRKASRSSLIQISNQTEFILQRISCKMQQGLLRFFPPEVIAPNSVVEFGSESNSFISGTKGSLIYLVLPPTIMNINIGSIQTINQMASQRLWEPFIYVTIEWSTPFWQSPTCSIITQSPMSAQHTISMDEVGKQIHTESKIILSGQIHFQVHKSSISPNTSSSTLPTVPGGGSSSSTNTNNNNNNNNNHNNNITSSPNLSPQNQPITNSPLQNNRNSPTGSYNLTSALSFFSTLAFGDPNNPNSPTTSSQNLLNTSSTNLNTIGGNINIKDVHRYSLEIQTGNNNSNNSNNNINNNGNVLSSSLPVIVPGSPSLPSSPLHGSSSNVNPFSFPLPWSTAGDVTDKDSWKNSVRRGTRGQFVTIVNKTNKHLIRRDYALNNGNWCELPPEGIPPNSFIEFGTVSSGFTSGTEGSVYYYSHGCKGDFRFQFSNPLMGKALFSSHCPTNFHIEEKSNIGNISYVLFTIVDQTNTINNIIPKPLSNSNNSTTTTTTNNNNNSNNSNSINNNNSNLITLIQNMNAPDDSIRVVSLNIGLLASNSYIDIEERIIQISKTFINYSEKYDIIAFQEVFLDTSLKDRFIKELRTFYPYIIDRASNGSGSDSGLFFASRFPILWNEFRQFNNGIGSDVKYAKGVLGLKLDISTVRENTCLYVFNANLQSNPDQSVAWKMVNGDDKQKKAETVRTLQLQTIRDFISTELSTTKSSTFNNSSVILCGDMNIIAEQEQIISDEGSIILSQIIPELAGKLNSKEIHLTFSYQLLDHLTDRNIPLRFLGILRSQVHSARVKSLILTEMTTLIIKKEIFDSLSQKHSQYSSMNEDEQYFREIVVDTINRVFHYERKESCQFWRIELKKKLKQEFASALSELEQQDWVDLRSHVINFQLFNSLRNNLDLALHTKAVFQIMKGSKINTSEVVPYPLITNDSIIEIILPPLTSYWGSENTNSSDIKYFSTLDFQKNASNQQAFGGQSNSLQIYLKQTSEYQSMLKILGFPVDTFRSCNPNLPGYTVHQALNQMVQKASCKERLDYILSFNLSPNFGDEDGRNKLLKMECLESNVLPLGVTPQNRLSNHFALECIFNVNTDSSSTK